MRRCLVCTLRDEPGNPTRRVHLGEGKGRPEMGYAPHRFDPGERRVRDQGRGARRQA